MTRKVNAAAWFSRINRTDSTKTVRWRSRRFPPVSFVQLKRDPGRGDISPYVWLVGAAFLIGVGSGIVSPVSRDAGADARAEEFLNPVCTPIDGPADRDDHRRLDRTAAIAGSSDPDDVQAWVYAVAVPVIAAMPLIARVLEHRGAW